MLVLLVAGCLALLNGGEATVPPTTTATEPSTEDSPGVKPSTVTAYVARGQFIPPAATVGATKLWKRSDVEAWAAQRPRKGKPRS